MSRIFFRSDEGWWPWVSPDGAYVAYGATTARMLCVATGEESLIGDGLPCGWLNAKTLLCHRMTQQGGLYTVTVPDLTQTPYSVADPTLLWGLGATGAIIARDNHWATWTGGRISHDGIWIQSPVDAHTVDCAGEWVVHGGTAGNGWAFYVYQQRVLQRVIPCPPPACNVFAISNNGTVAYGCYQYLRLNFADGLDIDAGCTGSEQVGSFMQGPGGVWLWTFACPDRMFACGRPSTGQRTCILVEGALLHPSAGMSIDGSMVVAGHDDVGRLLVTRVASTPLVEWVPPPAPTPSASFTLDRIAGPAPLTVTATLVSSHLTTWRWLLDETIHQPIDGKVHQFIIKDPGPHIIGLRTSPAINISPQIITVTAGVERPAFWRICSSMPICDYEATGLVERKWQGVRVEGTNYDEVLAQCEQHGWRPLWTLHRHEEHGVPGGIDIEIGNECNAGCEGDPPWPKLTPVEYAAWVMEAWPTLLAKGCTVYVGAINNPSVEALGWLKDVLALLPRHPQLRVSMHRYGDRYQNWLVPKKGHRSISAEDRAIVSCVDGRGFGISEAGGVDHTQTTGWWFWKKTITRKAVDGHKWQAERFKKLGADFYVVYQMHSGPGVGWPDEQGILCADLVTWRATANLPLL